MIQIPTNLIGEYTTFIEFRGVKVARHRYYVKSGCVTAVKRSLRDTPSSLTKESSLDQVICCDDKTTLHTSELLSPPDMVLR